MRANVERVYDEYERKAVEALMHENAHRSKLPKASDLFKRPVDGETAREKTEDLMEKAEQASAWLSRFEQFNSAGNAISAGKEEANGS